MKFKVENKTRDNAANLLRGLGYFYTNKDENTGQLVFIRSLAGAAYPRFHLYCKSFEGGPQNIGKLEFSLHLDQRRPRYKGQVAHNADYSGKVVEQEAQRIKNAFV